MDNTIILSDKEIEFIKNSLKKFIQKIQEIMWNFIDSLNNFEDEEISNE